MKIAATRSPKLKRLMRLAGLSRPEAVGTLELLWIFAMEQAPSADVGRWSDMDLEGELDWTGTAGALVEALVEAGWLDRCSERRLVIHDWEEHMPEFLKKRVVRGSLAVYSALPKPDNGGQRQTTADNGRIVPIREEKRREEKPREANRKNPSAPSSPALTERPDGFVGADRERILRWADEKGWGTDVLRQGLERFREWTPLKKPKRSADQWVSAFQRVTRESVESGVIVAGNSFDKKPRGLAYVEWTGHGAEEAS